MYRKEERNAGFSLVELVIVIAIMAILVGIVGTQVVPYIEKSRQSKDIQIVSGLCTSTVTAFASCAVSVNAASDYSLSYTASGLIDTPGTGFSATPADVVAELKTLTNYSDLTQIKNNMASKASADIDRIDLTYSGQYAIAIVKVQMAAGSRYGNVFLPISVK